MVDYEAMGRRMKARRRALKLSQGEVADAIQLSASFYGNIERGKRIPSVDTLVSIANALDVGVDFLLTDSVQAVQKQVSPEEARVLLRYLRERMAELDFSGVLPRQL